MGAVAIFYFFAAAFALATACSGKDVRAKFVAAYLLGTWAISNDIFMRHSPDDTLEMFTVIDILALGTMIPVWIRWPSRWLMVVMGALFGQIVLQIHHAVTPPEDRHVVLAFLRNEALWVVQLVAVVCPTIGPKLRFRRRAAPRAAIPPPYKGWKAPEA